MTRRGSGSCLGTARINAPSSRADPARVRLTSHTGASRRRAGAVHRGARTDLRGRPGSRHLLQGHVRQGPLLDWRRSTAEPGWRAGPRTREPEMGEDPFDDGGVIDRGNQLHSPGGHGLWRASRALPRRPPPAAGAPHGGLDQPTHAPSDRGSPPTLNSATDCLILIDRFRAAFRPPASRGEGAEGTECVRPMRTPAQARVGALGRAA